MVYPTQISIQLTMTNQNDGVSTHHVYRNQINKKRTYVYESPEVRVGSIDTCGFICASIGELDSVLSVDEHQNIEIVEDGDHDLDVY